MYNNDLTNITTPTVTNISSRFSYPSLLEGVECTDLSLGKLHILYFMVKIKPNVEAGWTTIGTLPYEIKSTARGAVSSWQTEVGVMIMIYSTGAVRLATSSIHTSHIECSGTVIVYEK